MKKLAFIFIFLLAFVTVDAQRTYALIAGVSNYGDTEVNLHNTTKDVKELGKVLKNQKAVVAMVTSKYANADNIMKKLDAIIKVAKPEDKILFFFSGHGTTGGIIVYGKTLFKYNDLVAKLSTAKTNKVFCFIDACMSGSVTDAGTSAYTLGQASNNKITFFMSSRADEFSFENQWLGNGYFTQALLKGLRGKADANGDKKITVSELYRYIFTDVTNRIGNAKEQQHPQLIGPKSNFGVVLAQW